MSKKTQQSDADWVTDCKGHVMAANRWYVIETSCFPNSWKVANDYYRPNNSTSEYFPSYSKAQDEADERNKRELTFTEAIEAIERGYSASGI